MELERIVIENIKRIRKKKHISQERLAEICNTSTSYIGLMETYKNVPKLSTIEKIADALNVSVTDLFTVPENINHKDDCPKNKKTKENLKKSIMKEFEDRLDFILAYFDDTE